MHKQVERAAEMTMSRCGPVSMEDSRDNCNCSHCGGCNYDDSSKEVEEFSMPLREYDDQGEKWFK